MSGGVYRDHRGDPVHLGRELGAGGEGSVFAVGGRPDLCAKIYHPDGAARRAAKIEAMIARRPPILLRGAVTWPVAALYALHGGGERRVFAGFLMPLRRGMIELYRLLVPDERMAIAGFLSARDLCLLAARIARAVAGVHGAGHVIGDLKPQNILVSPRSGRVALIDTDSFQIHDPRAGVTHRAAVFTPEYTAPELCGADPGRADRTPASDAFALAVLVHQILLGGAHPFEGRVVAGGPSVDRIPGRIQRGLCALVPGEARIRPAAGGMTIASLHPDLRALFIRAFGDGHASPESRPGAGDWQSAIRRAAGAMIRCRASPAHFHDRALAACPWCERRARTGIDLFLPDQGWQREILAAPDPMKAPLPARTGWLRRHARARAVNGTLTAAERAFLEKAGASLGFDRARVGQIIIEARAPRRSLRSLDPLRGLFARVPRPSWPSIPASSLLARLPRRGAPAAAAVAAAAGALWLSHPARPPRPAGAEVARRPVCEVIEARASIGNTRGQGAYLRSAPGLASDKVPLPEGTAVRLTGEARTAGDLAWSEVFVPSIGRSGWVASRYVIAAR